MAVCSVPTIAFLPSLLTRDRDTCTLNANLSFCFDFAIDVFFVTPCFAVSFLCFFLSFWLGGGGGGAVAEGGSGGWRGRWRGVGGGGGRFLY